MQKIEAENNIAVAQLVEGNPVATIVIDSQHRVTHWNRACAVLTGVPADQMIGRSEHWRAFYDAPRPLLADFVVDGAEAPAIDGYYHGKFRRSALLDDAYEAEDFFPNFGPDGRRLFFTAAAIRNGTGQIIGAIETLQDVTERRQAEVALRDKEAYLAQIVDGSSVATLVIDADHRVTHWNRACEALTGTLARQMIGTSDHWKAFYSTQRPILADLVLDDVSEREVPLLYHGRFRISPLTPGGYEVEDFFPHFGNSGRWLFFTAAPLRNSDGRIIGAIETLQDVTERRRAEGALRESEERYRQLSLTDSLTGLFNMRQLEGFLPHELARAQRYGRALSLMILDCDDFKGVNDRFGHLEGDRVLRRLAEVISQRLRLSDAGFRYGGEEFVVVLPETDGQDALAMAERLRTGFASQEVHSASGEAICCTVSIGVAEARPADNWNGVLRRADEACYLAKGRGKNCTVLADSVDSAD